MRLSLDTVTGKVFAPANPAEPLELFTVPLGSAPRTWFLPSRILPKLTSAGALASPLVSGKLEFAASASPAGVTNFSAPNVVTGSATVSTIPDDLDTGQELTTDENWSAAALMALFVASTKRFAELEAQCRWRNGAEVADDVWHYSQLFRIKVPNTVIQSVLVPGAIQLGSQFYLPLVTDYLGGGSTNLDGIATVNLPSNTVARIITANGESAWRLEVGVGVTTDVSAGRIRPIDYNPTDNARVWYRVAGV